MRKRLIGIDAGGTMTKVVLFDLSGNEVGSERRANVMLLPHEGWTERDADSMWRAACECIRILLEKTQTDPSDILAVTPSGYGGGVYLIDKDGVPVRNALVSTDTRTIPLIARWTASGRAAAVSKHIEQQIWPGQTLPILAWMQENEPDTLRRTAHVMSCKDFLRMRLCGDISTDPTDAGCAGIINVTRSEISREAFAEAGIAGWLDTLPPIGPATEIVGGVSDQAAAQTGLRPGTPVVRGVYDVVGCSLASGVERPDQLAAVAGTFSIHSTVHSRPSLNPLPTIQTPYPVAGQILATIATPTSASNLEWLCKTMLSAEAHRALIEGRSVYDICNDLVAGALTRNNNILFFPFLYDGPQGAPAGFLGLKAGVSLADIVRAVYEGVVFAHRYDMSYLLDGPDAADPKVIRLAGGPSRSAVWAQMFADGLGLPIEIANGSEFGAKGAAICASVATGVHADIPAAIAAMVRVEQRFEPDPVRAKVLTAKYNIYRAAIDVVAPLWSQTQGEEEFHYEDSRPKQALAV
ncbi:FGGY-family carbohydrate kinase [Pararhizobium sp.]|uniref:FGGY-family carbohydrate kinase n=1 Tax=Pararhizobium sp. TaxID=1977563 RepID=UPI00271AAB45|nr:FGGY-family carbohydrate kinase [Pararhizobium sp.]MDO9414537.1 FGGY-family carbohydrate kinase [Pararhizobium sp.]